MSRFMAVVAFVLVLCVGLTACAGGKAALTEKDAGRTVEVAKGGTLDITLEGNPTTGYIWQVTSGNDAVLKQVGDFEFKADSKLVGAGGKLTFHFEAVGAGQVALKMGYLRPWEKGVKPEKTFEVTVVVK